MRYAILLLLAGCSSVPEPTATLPEHTITEKRVFVPIDAALTAHPDTVPEGPVTEVFNVAGERKAALQACYGQLDQIKAVQGTPPC